MGYTFHASRSEPRHPLAFGLKLPDTPLVNVTVTQLTEQIIASYARVGGINHIDGKNLPSKFAIAQITVDLLQLLFPGFFQDRPVHSSEIKVETATLMVSVAERLEDEIHKSLESCRDQQPRNRDQLRKEAHHHTMDFLGQLAMVREILQTDVEAAFNGDPAALSREEIIVAYPCIESIAVQRLAHELYNRQVALIPRIMTEWAHGRTGMDLHPGARIGSHFFVDHCTGTVVGETCIIGNHVKMFHGVTLGATSTSGGQQLKGVKRHPTLEDHVTIYSGAVILGGDTVVGAGSTIGGNVFLTHSVPPNSIVLADDLKMKIINKRDRSSPVLDFQI